MDKSKVHLNHRTPSDIGHRGHQTESDQTSAIYQRIIRVVTYGPSRHQPQTSTHHSSSPRQEHPWLEAEPMELDPQHSWGETIMDYTPGPPISKNATTPANTLAISASFLPPMNTNLSTNDPKMAGPSNTPSDA